MARYTQESRERVRSAIKNSGFICAFGKALNAAPVEQLPHDNGLIGLALDAHAHAAKSLLTLEPSGLLLDLPSGERLAFRRRPHRSSSATPRS